jgi:hypothetical protein
LEILNYIQSYASYKDEDGIEHRANLIWGASSKPMGENVIEVVVVATGFSAEEFIPRAMPPKIEIELSEENEEEEIISTLEPAKKPLDAAPRAPHASMPAILDRRPSKYANLEAELKIPSYRRRNVELVVESDGATRRKEVYRDEQDNESSINDNKLF